MVPPGPCPRTSLQRLSGRAWTQVMASEPWRERPQFRVWMWLKWGPTSAPPTLRPSPRCVAGKSRWPSKPPPPRPPPSLGPGSLIPSGRQCVFNFQWHLLQAHEAGTITSFYRRGNWSPEGQETRTQVSGSKALIPAQQTHILKRALCDSLMFCPPGGLFERERCSCGLISGRSSRRERIWEGPSKEPIQPS